MKNSGLPVEQGRRAWPPRGWRLYVPIVLTVVAGLVVTLVVFTAFQGSERGRMHGEFETMASDRAQAIRSGLSEDSTEIDLLAAYVRAAEELARNQYGGFALEFGRFARRIPSQDVALSLLRFLGRFLGPWSLIQEPPHPSFLLLSEFHPQPQHTLRLRGECVRQQTSLTITLDTTHTTAAFKNSPGMEL